MRGDGDGWQDCDRGERHWGVLGGARDSEETPEHAALREAYEEGGVHPAVVRPTARFVDDHGGWSYSTVVARPTGEVTARPTGGESIDVRWVPLDEVADLPLHPGFAASWPAVRRCLHRLVLLVDAANVVGSVPDGWWRDRAGATARLRDRLAALGDGIPADAVPTRQPPAPEATRWFPETLLVVEGAARAVADAAGPAAVATVSAPGSGDDATVALVRQRRAAAPDDQLLVITADRELRARCRQEGAQVAGPRWLQDLLPH
jgi:ADP-ribose pyrophosphatase YjhB (NUDIX family)